MAPQKQYLIPAYRHHAPSVSRILAYSMKRNRHYISQKSPRIREIVRRGISAPNAYARQYLSVMAYALGGHRRMLWYRLL